MAKNGLAGALRLARRAKQMSQEDFDGVSSRIYISELERGVKKPTLSKIEELAGVLGIHPLTVCLLAYLDKEDGGTEIEELQQKVGVEALKILNQQLSSKT